MTFPRWVFLLAGVYGLIALVPQYFMESRVGQALAVAPSHVL